MNVQTLGRPVEILLVEDNPGDVRLTKEVLKEGNVPNQLHVIMDGEEAMRYLHRESPHHRARRPDVILLDLNLPRKNGREVLAEIKQDPQLQSIPVLILTTSRSDEDIAKTYHYHANCYITKPVDLDKFINVVRGIENFWLTIAQLPPNPLQ